MAGYMRKEKLKLEVLSTVESKERFYQDIELYYILDGVLNLTVDNRIIQLKPEDILVVNANKKHGFTATDNILFARLNIAYELVSDVVQKSEVIFRCDSTRDTGEGYQELRRAMKRLLNNYLSTQGDVTSFGHIALCYQVMNILTINFMVQIVNSNNMTDEEKFETRIMQISNYIRENYSQPISIKELADKLYLSNGYLSRFFKKNYGMSFAEYLTNIRLYHAVDQLLYTEAPITRIAYDNGFPSVAVFNKSFKQAYGLTPTSMRKNAAARTAEPDSEEQENDDTTVQLEEYLKNENADQSIEETPDIIEKEHSLKTSAPLEPVWQKIINCGAAEDLLNSEIRDHIALLKDTPGFEYARFWNPFTRQMMIDIDLEDNSYNFSRLDSVFDFLIQNGFKPLLELGQKPKKIQRKLQDIVVCEDEQNVFSSIEQWDRLIEAFIKHLSHRYGSEVIDDWKIEIWYDIHYLDCEGGIRDYYQIFDHTYEIVRRYSEKLEVGGAGLQIDSKTARNEQFLSQWSRYKYKPDFVSFMYYAYELGENYEESTSKRHTDNEGLLHRLNQVKELLEKTGLSDKQLYLSEWNISISDRNSINDSCFKGAYIVKNVIDVYDKVDGMGYFRGTDRTSEYSDTSELLFGGVGLYSKDGILKPAGVAFQFLNKLYPFLTAAGRHYLISTDQKNAWGIVCHNQRKLSYIYYLTDEDQIDKRDIGKYLEDRDSLELRLKLTDAAEGWYHVKTYRLSETEGSILNNWEQLGYEKYLSTGDIGYLDRASEPKLSIRKIKSADGALDIRIRLAANEIAFIKIEKI
ncbi:MAG: GH39 family glycosyl hydrolase [Eubacteriaceae bacterium]|jgi:beta-xylosidase/AraC-like DNA-binding protein